MGKTRILLATLDRNKDPGEDNSMLTEKELQKRIKITRGSVMKTTNEGRELHAVGSMGQIPGEMGK